MHEDGVHTARARTHTHTHTHKHAHTYMYTHTHIHVHPPTPTHPYTHTNTHTHTHTHTHTQTVHADGGDEPMTFAQEENENAFTPVHMQSPAQFQAPWSPGMSGDVTFSPMAPTSPDANYGYQSPAYQAPQVRERERESVCVCTHTHTHTHACRLAFSKVFYIVSLSSKYTRALTFQFFFL